ncbi:MAG TPA: hypothetical protein VNL77_18595 [Roseiflexaceae bacterium]|nr:hypothetical protein [Roseiflexaceae bacterium]
MAKLYCQVTGVVLLLVGVLGIVWPGIAGLLSINEPAEIAVHLLTGALASYAGFSGGYGRLALLYAKVFGVIYILLAIVGFIFQGQELLGLLHFDLGCNLVHLVLGIWGVAAGYLLRPAAPATT